MYSDDDGWRLVANRLLYRIRAQPLRTYPFDHFCGDAVFEESTANAIHTHWPSTECFFSISETKRVSPISYRERNIISLPDLVTKLGPDKPSGRFWSTFYLALASDEFQAGIIEWLWPSIKAQRTLPDNISIYGDVILTDDSEGYSIGPHTDAPSRLVTILFYVPTGPESAHAGTSLFVPKNHELAGKVSPIHHLRENFLDVYTAPFLPNSFLGFVVGPRSYHGVDAVSNLKVSRRQIQYSLRYKAI